jgi:hypothetical protein
VKRSVKDTGNRQVRFPVWQCTVFLPKAWYAIIGTQEIVRDAITRKQAQRVVERYILPDAQQDDAETIEYSLNVLFGLEREGEP